jgi:hypothetical protein
MDYHTVMHNLWLARQKRLLSHGRDSVWILLYDAEADITRKHNEIASFQGDQRLPLVMPASADYYGAEPIYRQSYFSVCW